MKASIQRTTSAALLTAAMAAMTLTVGASSFAIAADTSGSLDKPWGPEESEMED